MRDIASATRRGGCRGVGQPVIITDPAGAKLLTAHFVKEDQKDFVHYWHFNNLPGYDSLLFVDSDYSFGGNSQITYPGSGIVLGDVPVLDKLGQWNLGDWEDKIYSFEQLKKEWEAEDQLPLNNERFKYFDLFKIHVLLYQEGFCGSSRRYHI